MVLEIRIGRHRPGIWISNDREGVVFRPCDLPQDIANLPGLRVLPNTVPLTENLVQLLAVCGRTDFQVPVIIQMRQGESKGRSPTFRDVHKNKPVSVINYAHFLNHLFPA